LYCPRWSPNGHQISATNADGRKIKQFDFNRQTWTELAEVTTGCTAWSRDGGYLYFENLYVPQPAVFRIRTSDKKRELIAGLNLRLAQGLEWWSGVVVHAFSASFRVLDSGVFPVCVGISPAAG
jgi:hypothetical protein